MDSSLRIGKIGDGKMRLTVIVNVKKSVIATVNRKRMAVIMDRMTLILNMEMIDCKYVDDCDSKYEKDGCDCKDEKDDLDCKYEVENGCDC